MIYFIQMDNDGPIKIGRADSIPRRIAGLQVGNPTKLKLLGVMPEEKDLHHEFADIGLRGEWFKPDERLLAFVKQYTFQNDEWRGWGDIEKAMQRRRSELE